MIHNYQSRHLARHGNNPLEWGCRLTVDELRRTCLGWQWEAVTVGTADEVLVESARNTLQRCMLVGTVERFDVFWDKACGLLGVASTPVPNANVAKNKLKKNELDVETLELIHRHTEIDRKIYEYAVALASPD